MINEESYTLSTRKLIRKLLLSCKRPLCTAGFWSSNKCVSSRKLQDIFILNLTFLSSMFGYELGSLTSEQKTH